MTTLNNAKLAAELAIFNAQQAAKKTEVAKIVSDSNWPKMRKPYTYKHGTAI